MLSQLKQSVSGANGLVQNEEDKNKILRGKAQEGE